jgi:flavin-dependent dehydrogenase
LVKQSLNRPCSTGFVCKREHLDKALFEEAKKYVDVLEGIKVKGLLFEENHVVGVYSENRNFRAKIVVGADGANGITAKALGVGTLDENHHAVAIRSYYSNIKGMTDHIELHFLDEVQPGYFWIFPTNQATGEANIGLGVLSKNVRNKNLQLKHLLQKITQEHPQFRARFAQAECLAPIKGWSLPFGSKKRPIAFNGALLVGDAAGLIDPMSGEGIENAFRSAECAAKTIRQALIAEDFSLSFLLKYEKAVEALLRPELRKGYWIQKASQNPTFLKLIFWLLKHFRFSRRLIANKFF